MMSAPRDFDIGVARRLAFLEKKLAYLESIVVNPGLSTSTWTPTFVGSGTAGVFTYTNQVGFYTVIGNLVFIGARVSISAIGTPPVGVMRIGGLPFASAGIHYTAIQFGFVSNINYTAAAIELTGFTGVGLQRIDLYEVFDNAVAVAFPAANFTNVAADIILSGFYKKA